MEVTALKSPADSRQFGAFQSPLACTQIYFFYVNWAVAATAATIETIQDGDSRPFTASQLFHVLW